MTRFYKTIACILRPIVKLLFRFEISGFDKVKNDGKLLLCANHQSFWDIVFLLVFCPVQINFMAKKELFKFKPLGWIFKKMGAFPINRGGSDLSAIKHAEDILNSGGVLGIFPEGTRHPLGAPHKAKAGAAMMALDTRTDILPVAIRYPKKPLLFKKIKINVGEVIKVSSFITDDKFSKSEIKQVTNLITENITNLWENAI